MPPAYHPATGLSGITFRAVCANAPALTSDARPTARAKAAQRPAWPPPGSVLAPRGHGGAFRADGLGVHLAGRDLELVASPVAAGRAIAGDDEFAVDTAVVHVANVIANNIQAPVSRDDDTILNEKALDTLKIDHAKVESYYEEVYALLDDILDMLYYDIAA